MGGVSASRPLPVISFAVALGAVAVALGAAACSARPADASADKKTASSGDRNSSRSNLGGPQAAVASNVLLQPAAADIAITAREIDWARNLVLAVDKGDCEAVSRLISAAAGAGGHVGHARGEMHQESELKDHRDPASRVQQLLLVQAELSPIWPSVTGLFVAALRGHTDVLEVLLAARADPDTKSQKATTWDGAFTLTERDTPLCAAAKEGHRRCVELLLAARADPNLRCHSEFFEGAVEWGDDDDGTDTTFYTALDLAVLAGQTEIADLLQRSGGQQVSKESSQPRRKLISSGSRMGA